MTENAKVSEVLRALFALPISAEQRLRAFFLWIMLLPEDPKAAKKAKQRRSYCKHRDKHKAERQESNRQWRKNNPGRHFAAVRAWKKANPDAVRIMYRERERRRRQNPDYCVKQSLRHRLYLALKGLSKSARTLELLDMELPEFEIYIQGQFQPGMTWENYGPVWHIDHKRPCASFELSDPAQQRECFHWSNTQPMFAKENLEKGATYVPAG